MTLVHCTLKYVFFTLFYINCWEQLATIQNCHSKSEQNKRSFISSRSWIRFIQTFYNSNVVLKICRDKLFVKMKIDRVGAIKAWKSYRNRIFFPNRQDNFHMQGLIRLSTNRIHWHTVADIRRRPEGAMAPPEGGKNN